jgi:hypothetical protein
MMPPMDQLLHTLQDYVKDHAVKLITGLVLMALGWFFGSTTNEVRIAMC